MKVYHTRRGVIVAAGTDYYLVPGQWDEIVNKKGLSASLRSRLSTLVSSKSVEPLAEDLLCPIGSQEVWAAGVTYFRSKEARMDESKDSGGASFYDRVYEAERPELFFKSLPHRVSGPGSNVHIRKDSSWNVPEPELTLFISSEGTIEGYTIGNDMSSRSIEGENPLYLPQAKTYDRSAAIGPCLYVPPAPLPSETEISMQILRGGKVLFEDHVPISRMKRKHDELAGFLFRELTFPSGVYLMTGTCLVPPPDFTLQVNDEVQIQIDPIGILTNTITQKT